MLISVECETRFSTDSSCSGQPAILYAWLQETEPSGSTLTSIYLERATQLLEPLGSYPESLAKGYAMEVVWMVA